MKKNISKAVLTVLVFLWAGKISFAQWTNVNPINPVGDGRATTFIIGDTCYYGNGEPYSNSFYGYTPQSNTWYAETACPSGGGDMGFEFTIGDTAYVGDGDNPGYHNDCWAYIPAKGWTKVADPPGGGRGFSSGFSIGHKGYFGTGLISGSPPLNDFYEYDPLANLWTTLSSIPAARFGGVAFSANGKGYMGLGYKDNSTMAVLNDMYEYDPATNTWRSMAPLPAGFGEAEPAYFVQCGKLIITLGQTLHSVSKATIQTWMFDPTDGSAGKWYRLPDCPAYPAYSPQGFSLRDTGYIVGGTDTTTFQSVKQMFRYVPNINPISVTSSVTMAAGNSVVLTADGGGAFKWSPSTGLSDTVTTSTLASGGITNVIASPSVTTTYTVTEAVCGQTATIVVTVAPSLSHCSANFKLLPDSTTPHHWFALNESTGKSPITYNWTWGDGASGTGDTASHVYAAAGYYTICLTISDDSACTSTYCDSSVYLYRMDGSNTMVYVNVVNSVATGLPSVKNIAANNLLVLPNPCNTCEVKGIDNAGDIFITDILGREISYSFTKEAGAYTINFQSNLTGIFLLHNVKTGQVIKFIKQ